MEISLPMFMLLVGILIGMILVWAFGIAHDLIVNWYRKAIYARELEKEKKALETMEKDAHAPDENPDYHKDEK
jgi:hypothetical protein